MKTELKQILKEVSGLDGIPQGAYSFRINGETGLHSNSDNTEIVKKLDRNGIDVTVRANTKNEIIHIPTLIDHSGLNDLVYNDFFIGENSEVHIIAGCGIHNDGLHATQHSGVHTFYVGKNSKVKYEEKHYGQGTGTGNRIISPETVIYLSEGSSLDMDSVQIDGVDYTKRLTKATIGDDASLTTKEVILTTRNQTAYTDFRIELDGKNSSCSIVSRSVAKGESKQFFYSVINGNNECYGHSACDAIIMDDATVKAVPDVTANHVDAQLVHEAAIGKIAGNQITKLMSLGLTYEQAEAEIVAAFLR